MSERSALVPVRLARWGSGFRNLLRRENRVWWKTRKWAEQSLVWLVVANGVLAFLLWVVPLVRPDAAPTGAEAVSGFLVLFGISTPLGVMVLTQGLIVREKQLGTAAWVLAGPVSRASFILSKLIAHGTGILAIIVALQGAIAYLQISLRLGELLPFLPFAAAMGLHGLHLLFYIALALMLGTFSSNRGPVIGLSVGLWFVQQAVGVAVGVVWPGTPPLFPGNLPDVAPAVALGQPLPSVVPVVSAAVLVVLFLLAALWRFQREEF